MKKKLFVFGLSAVLLGGTLISSCQKQPHEQTTYNETIKHILSATIGKPRVAIPFEEPRPYPID